MIITTTDPISGKDISNLETKPFIIEGEGHLAVKIYFESDETRRCYLNTEIEHPDRDFRYSIDNPDPGRTDYN